MRATFIIDRQGIVRHQVVNDEPLGRNMDEVVRIVDALQYFEKNGRVCPAGWTKGSEGFSPTKAGVANYLSKNASGLTGGGPSRAGTDGLRLSGRSEGRPIGVAHTPGRLGQVPQRSA